LGKEQGGEMEKESQIAQERKILEIVYGLLLSEVAFQEILKKYKGGASDSQTLGAGWMIKVGAFFTT